MSSRGAVTNAELNVVFQMTQVKTKLHKPINLKRLDLKHVLLVKHTDKFSF